MKQLSLPGLQGPELRRIVNVASVTHRSPLRYPGGKTWLVPRIREWLAALPQKPAEFIEPFAGGGIVSLTVAAEGLAEHVTMVEMDARVASVWQTIMYGDANWLAEQIESFDFNPETVAELLAQEESAGRELAFQTVVRNRVSHGGIMAPGAGVIKNGEAGRGLGSRWYPTTLSKRIRQIARVRERFTFIEGDGLRAIEDNCHRSDAVFFIDPPYTAPGKRAGSRLYTHFALDHERLFALMQTAAGDFLMTYDNAESVRSLAKKHGFDVQPIAMKNTHHAKQTELLIGRNMAWARDEVLSGGAPA